MHVLIAIALKSLIIAEATLGVLALSGSGRPPSAPGSRTSAAPPDHACVRAARSPRAERRGPGPVGRPSRAWVAAPEASPLPSALHSATTVTAPGLLRPPPKIGSPRCR